MAPPIPNNAKMIRHNYHSNNNNNDNNNNNIDSSQTKKKRQSPPSYTSSNRCLREYIHRTIVTVVLFSQLLSAQSFLFNSKKTADGVATSAPHNDEHLDACCLSALPGAKNAHSGMHEVDDFCRAFGALSIMDQHVLRGMLGCDDDDFIGAVADEHVMQKRKPNFIRFGRSAPPSFGSTRRLSDPNFLRFGRSAPLDELPSNFYSPEKKSANGVSANFLRFGKAASDPNFLRFGKRASSSSILGAAADSSAPNFLRFGRNGHAALIGSDDIMEERFSREYRKPNFLRFG